MVIVVQPSSYRFFGISPLASMILAFAKTHTHTKFILLGDEAIHISDEIPANLKIEKIQPARENNLTNYYWRKIKLPAYLQKINADYFITDAFLPINYEGTKSVYLSAKSFAPPLLEVPYKPSSTEDVGGFSFYLNDQSAANAIIVLKAFSIFKKRMRSGLKLYLVFDSETQIFIPGLANYKYRTELVNCNCSELFCLQELAKNSVAFFYLPKAEPDELLVRTVLQKGAVIITDQKGSLKPALQNLVIPVQPLAEDLAAKMMEFYKNESLAAAYRAAATNYIAAEPKIILQDILEGRYDYIKPV